MGTYYKPQSPIKSGEDFIYPITTADQIMKSDNSRRLEQAGLIVADDSTKLGGKAPEYYLQPRNLLDNSDFTNPVNQRGITSETDILRYAYFIDRWHSSADITTKYGLSNQGVTISGDAGIRQDIEGIGSGTVLTAAVKYGGKIICVTGTIKYDGTSYKTIAYYGDGTANVFLVTQGGNAGIMISKDTNVSSITVEWAALYKGSYTADTLPPYVPKGYAAELAECQRYYYQSWVGANFIQLDGIIICEAISPSRCTNVIFPQTMRSNPTVTLYAPLTGNTGKVADFVTDAEVNATSIYKTKHRFALASAANEFEAGKHYYLHYSANADL